MTQPERVGVNAAFMDSFSRDSGAPQLFNLRQSQWSWKDGNHDVIVKVTREQALHLIEQLTEVLAETPDNSDIRIKY